MPTPIDRAQVIADAAVRVIADSGIRALTHRAVDLTSGLPAGTTSYNYRTRRELLQVILVRVAESGAELIGQSRLGPVGRLPVTRSERVNESDRIADRYSTFVEAQVTGHRVETLARYSLQLEVASDPELSEITRTSPEFEQLAVDNARRIGARRPKRAGRYLVAFIEGLTYQYLVGTGSRAQPGIDRESIKLGLLAYLVGLIPD